jgi:Sugar phosphate permease
VLPLKVKVRWWIIFILFLAWMMSYFDRSMFSVALPFIGKNFSLSPIVMGFSTSAFFLGYAIMQIPGGMISDKFGSRKTVALGVLFWSIFSALTGVAGSLVSLILIRILFGLGEGIFPPGSWKMVSNWFSSKGRASANSMMLSSNLVGPALAPIVFAPMIGVIGWRPSFFILAIPGALIAAVAIWYLRDHPKDHPSITQAELKEISTGKDSTAMAKQEKIPVGKLLKFVPLWQLFFIWMTWDTTWWGFLSWLPTYLYSARGFTLIKTGLLTSLPYLVGLIGMVLAGYIADRLHNRKIVIIPALLGNALFMVLTVFSPNVTTAIICLIGLGFFLPSVYGPFWSLPMDLLPSQVMGYAAGFINLGGQIAGFVAPIVIGYLVQSTGNYVAGFIFMAIAAVLSAIITMTLSEKKSLVNSQTSNISA